MQIECRISSLLEYYAEMQPILYKDTALNQNIQDFTQKKYGTTLAEQRRKAYV